MTDNNDELAKLWSQYQTVKDTIREIDAGAAYVAIKTSVGYTDTDDIFESPNYLHQMRGDLLYYRQDLRRQIITKLQEEDRIEQGYETEVKDGQVEPVPIGTPKNDYRKTLTDADDGK